MKLIEKSKSQLILAFIIVTAFTLGQIVQPPNSYAATDIGKLTNNGDTITKTRTNGESWTFTSTLKANYSIILKGPAASGKGGTTTANVPMNVGDTLEIFLGDPAVAVAENGSGYGDSGTHKATVKLKGTLIMVAGGGGAKGAKGSGNGEVVETRYANHGTTTCPICGYKDPSTNMSGRPHNWYNGTGGEGGKGGDGGGAAVTPGLVGQAGSAQAGWFSGLSYATYYYAGGQGGTGGSGGASYTNATYSLSPQLLQGTSEGEASVTITMGEEIFPPLDSKLVLEMKKDIIQKIDMIEGVPVYTVVANKPFDFYADGYSSASGGANSNVTVTYVETSGTAVRIHGTLPPGSTIVAINSKKYIFNVVEEPDSANVKVVFN